MAGIDFTTAGIDVREQLSLSKSGIESAYGEILANEKILGAVIISTCNRTEIYLSCVENCTIKPFEILCKLAGVAPQSYVGLYKCREGRAVTEHLCALACGTLSLIFGEDQIISQVRDAITLSREYGAADSVLEVLFRSAVSAAKKVKTAVHLESRETSVVQRALEVLSAENVQAGAATRVLIIGNGEIGRLTATTLLAAGYKVTMTLRHYHHGENIIPDGADVVDFSLRYGAMSACDAVISATLSPHYTVEAVRLAAVDHCPKLFIDLAVPRDIEPAVARRGATLYDIDTLSPGMVSEAQERQRGEIAGIIENYVVDYERWCEFKMGLSVP